jgi:hypothetical protein
MVPPGWPLKRNEDEISNLALVCPPCLEQALMRAKMITRRVLAIEIISAQ